MRVLKLYFCRFISTRSWLLGFRSIHGANENIDVRCEVVHLLFSWDILVRSLLRSWQIRNYQFFFWWVNEQLQRAKIITFLWSQVVPVTIFVLFQIWIRTFLISGHLFWDWGRPSAFLFWESGLGRFFSDIRVLKWAFVGLDSPLSVFLYIFVLKRHFIMLTNQEGK